MPEVIPTHAASLVILRDGSDGLEVLMGRRRKSARFMPGYYVYPGGAIDPLDAVLANACTGATPYHMTALRETWEEAGVAIATPGTLPADIPRDDPFCQYLDAHELVPAASQLHYIARAVTPKHSPIRFDTKFFLADSSTLHGTAHAVGELPEVMWIPTSQALTHSLLSDVTLFVLKEALRVWADPENRKNPNRRVNLLTYRNDRHVINAEDQATGLALA